ncbi:MAG: gamma-glutamyl-gamma-aminobutyrate hydrolase family protein [Nannocystaceae bacterium]|nr:gamma-glutamyl-gamma-aminobutyrate hydrolase family protein [bacterium]
MKPRIGVSGPDFGGAIAWVFTWLAIMRAGGRAVRLTPRRRSTLAGLDGLVVGGGVDIAETLPTAEEPAKGQSWLSRLAFRLVAPFWSLLRRLATFRDRPSGDLARDALEVRLLRSAREEGIPTLGICRGSQLMARVEDGSLAKDVGAGHPDRPVLWTPLPSRAVKIDPDSRLHDIVGASRTTVNSLHRHAVECVPPPLRPVAWEQQHPIVQAIEATDRPFWIGVQWHPEYLVFDRCQQNLFRRLVLEAQAHTSNLVCASPVASRP